AGTETRSLPCCHAPRPRGVTGPGRPLGRGRGTGARGAAVVARGAAGTGQRRGVPDGGPGDGRVEPAGGGRPARAPATGREADPGPGKAEGGPEPAPDASDDLTGGAIGTPLFWPRSSGGVSRPTPDLRRLSGAFLLVETKSSPRLRSGGRLPHSCRTCST